jgi:hypothetical protein
MSGVTFGGKEHITCPPPDGWPERARLITLADAEAMVRAENEACAKVARDIAPMTEIEIKAATKFAVGGDVYDKIPLSRLARKISSAISARVKPHNN